MSKLEWKRRRVILLTGIACLLLGLWPAGQKVLMAANDDTPDGAQVVVKAVTPQAIVVELTVHGYTVENVEQAGEVFQRVNITGTEQTAIPGAPQTPSRSALLGLPTTTGVAVQVLEANYATQTGYKLYPATQPT